MEKNGVSRSEGRKQTDEQHVQKLKNLDSLGNCKHFRIVEVASTRENGGEEAGKIGPDGKETFMPGHVF